MTPQQYLDSIQDLRAALCRRAQELNTPTAATIGRQTLDSLDAAALFGREFWHYAATIDDTREAKAEEAVNAGQVLQFDAGSSRD